ncbi:type II secretion system protein F [Brevibacterium sp. 5221]|uniref:Type II secretion system protein F n=1 Tax=Brevibacterium rongguiense TaxID=2695267 RepID=A0A6N9H4N0_9MICO|nr:type II secretion system F family protein [Brevibacterium rongguiense]MYM18726.1 type II secretion system protein F [Brevibacterium rongguiense]
MTVSTQSLLCGLALGSGLFCLWSACWEQPPSTRERPRMLRDLDDMLTAAGLPRLRPAHLAPLCAGCGFAVALIAVVLTGALSISACFGLFAATAPYLLVRMRAQRTAVQRRTLWPEAIDHLNSGVRAGLSLPEAVSGLAERGPDALRPLFGVFAREYRATGSFSLALDRFKDASADPVADRIVAALQVTREVGGTDLGTMLRTLAQFLREDARTRSEMLARQSWTVTGARLAVAAPWIVLALLATRRETALAYNTPEGALLLGAGLVVSLAAYAGMKRIGRLPGEPRVLR